MWTDCYRYVHLAASRRECSPTAGATGNYWQLLAVAGSCIGSCSQLLAAAGCFSQLLAFALIAHPS